MAWPADLTRFLCHSRRRVGWVEARTGAIAMPRFPSLLIKPNVRISRIRLAERFHRGHTADVDVSVVQISTPPWRRDTACSERAWSDAVLHRLAPSHQPLPSSTSIPDVRVLPAAGMTRLQQSYDPVRHPPVPPPVSDIETATPAHDGPPQMTRIAFPTCRAPYPSGSRRVPLWMASPLTRPSPSLRRVGIRNFTFETGSGFPHVTARWMAQLPKAALS